MREVRGAVRELSTAGGAGAAQGRRGGAGEGNCEAPMRTLKIDVEEGSMSTATGHGLVDPKRWGHPVSMAHYAPCIERGSSQYSRTGLTRLNPETPARPLEEFSFLFNGLTTLESVHPEIGPSAGKALELLRC